MLLSSWLLVILLILRKAKADLDTLAELENFEKGSFLLDVKEFVDESAPGQTPHQTDLEGGDADILGPKNESQLINESFDESPNVAYIALATSDADSDDIELHSEDAVNAQTQLESNEAIEESDLQDDDTENIAGGPPEPGSSGSEFETELASSETQEPIAREYMLEASSSMIFNVVDEHDEAGAFQKAASSSAHRVEKIGSAIILPVLVIAISVMSTTTVF